MGRIIEPYKQFFDDVGDPLTDGWIHFLESGTTSTDKDTFSDPSETTPNSNPLQLDAAGRCPDVFGSGSYRGVLYTHDPLLDSPGVQVQVKDPIGGSVGTSIFDDWAASGTYSVGDIVTGTDGNYYRSLTNENENNNPISNPGDWEEIDFNRYWNTNVTYSQYDVVIVKSTGLMYLSLQDSNVGNDPGSATAYWQKQVGIYNVVEDVTPQSGGDWDMNGHDLLMGDNQIVEAILKDTGELVQALGSLSSNTEIDRADGDTATFTVAGSFTLTFAGWKATGILNGLLLKITDGTAYTITWPTISWDSGSLPELQASGVDWVLVWTEDNSSTVFGKRVYQEA